MSGRRKPERARDRVLRKAHPRADRELTESFRKAKAGLDVAARQIAALRSRAGDVTRRSG